MRNFTVTASNVGEVPLDWLLTRYYRLKRKIDVSKEMEKEVKIIKEYFQARNLQLPEEDNAHEIRKKFAPIVEYRLREYPQLLSRKAWVKESIEFITKNVNGYGNGHRFDQPGAGTGNVVSKVEREILAREDTLKRLNSELLELDERIYPIVKAMSELNSEEHELVRLKYLSGSEKSDLLVMETMLLNRQKYYLMKKSVLTKIAESLEII